MPPGPDPDLEQALLSELISALHAYRNAIERWEQVLKGAARTIPNGDDELVEMAVGRVRGEYERKRDSYMAVVERWDKFVLTGNVPN